MQDALIHSAYAGPSQLAAAQARRERRARFDEAAVLVAQTPAPAVAPEPEVVEPEVAVDPAEAWVDRQKAIPLPDTRYWFSVEEDLGPVVPPVPPRPSIEHIQKVVANYFNITREDILSPRRTASVVRPRMIAVYLARKLTVRSCPEIGRRTGDRDHTTVLSAFKKIDGLTKADPALATIITELTEIIQPTERVG